MKIVMGMSGGVDSSVAAKLLVEQGHKLIGVFMQNWQADNDDPHCSAEQDLTDARSVCDKLGIPLKTVSFAKEYWDRVFQYFLDEYSAGRTPNPDILCNKEIKFKAFLDYALELGADAIATGHYARIGKSGDSLQLLRGLDHNKDQSYFLYTLGQRALKHALFPIGEMEKPEVRRIAEEAGFINSNKKDSTGICFIGERKFKSFLNEYLLAQPGNIETTDGDVIGSHQGLMFYTLGQRQGLQLGGLKNYKEAPWYVLDKDISRNVLIAGQDHDHPLLMKKSLVCDQLHWVSGTAPEDNTELTAKVRYRHTDQECVVRDFSGSRIFEKVLPSNVIPDKPARSGTRMTEVEFKQAQRAITPGQSVVFYKDEVCLGGGIITGASNE